MGTVPQEETRDQYVADGIEDIYTYSYFIPLEKDITVWVTPAGSPPNETVDIKILNTDYSVQNAGVPGGGTITFLPGKIPGSGAIVTMVRSVVDSITTNYVDARTIRGDNLDESFEREMLVTQQNVTNLDRTALRYQNNAFLPDSLTRNVVPTLDPNFFWKGSGAGGVVAVEDKEEAGCSSLRSELASEVQGVDGAGLVGYFDENRLISTKVRTQLNEYGDPTSGQDGARLIGYYDPVNLIETNVGDQLDIAAGFPEKLQNGFAVYGDDIGAADSIIVNIAPAYKAYTAGTKVFIKIANNNETQSPTINLNGLGAKTIVNNNGDLVDPNTLKANSIYQFVYDGTNFQLLLAPVGKGIFSQTDDKVIANTAAQVSVFGTLVGTTTLEPNALIPGSFYRYIVKGSVVKGTVSGTAFVGLKINGTTIITEELHVNGASLPDHNIDIVFDLVVKTIGSPSVVDVWEKLERFDTLLNVKNPDVVEVRLTDSTNINSTIANTIDIFVQFTQADPSNVFTSRAATVTRLY